MVEIANLNLWGSRQSECVAHGWRFGEKIMQDRCETVTLELAIRAVVAGEPIF